MKKLVGSILDNKLKQFRNSCPYNITDLVFLEIEKSHRAEYNHSVNKLGVDSVNTTIGKFIREYWNLKNTGRCKRPQSELIASYEKHSN